MDGRSRVRPFFMKQRLIYDQANRQSQGGAVSGGAGSGLLLLFCPLVPGALSLHRHLPPGLDGSPAAGPQPGPGQAVGGCRCPPACIFTPEQNKKTKNGVSAWAETPFFAYEQSDIFSTKIQQKILNSTFFFFFILFYKNIQK